MNSSIKDRWQWIAVWLTLLCGCYWVGDRRAAGAPTPCDTSCTCVQVQGVNTYLSGVRTGTNWYYVVPPLGPQGPGIGAFSLFYVSSGCFPGKPKDGQNQMYVDTTDDWADACIVPADFSGNTVAKPPTPIVYPGPKPPPIAQGYCG